MKTFRKIGMALFAILMSTNFVSCDKDENSTIQSSEEKKLIKMSTRSVYDNVDEGNDDVYDYKYSQDGRISEIHISYYSNGEEIDEDIYKYNWHSKDSMTVTLNGELIDCFYFSNGKIIRNIEYFHNREYFNQFTYNNDGPLNSYSTWTSTWSNDKLLQSNDYYIRYSDTTCKGFFPLFCAHIGPGGELFVAHPEFVGLKTTYLPTELGDKLDKYTFSYEFDTDGYVVSCTITHDEFHGGHYSSTYGYEFVWE